MGGSGDEGRGKARRSEGRHVGGGETACVVKVVIVTYGDWDKLRREKMEEVEVKC